MGPNQDVAKLADAWTDRLWREKMDDTEHQELCRQNPGGEYYKPETTCNCSKWEGDGDDDAYDRTKERELGWG